MSKIGWIKFHRQIQESDIWKNKEPFDKRSAWVDLIMMANHEDKEIFIKGKSITVRRGQRVTSMYKLADRWHWSRGKVLRYITYLERNNMITRESNSNDTIITIVNYNIYQDVHTTNDTTNDTTCGTTNDTTSGTQTRRKEDKEVKKNIYGEFRHVKLSEEDLQKLHDEYGEQMTNDCIKYLDEYIEMKPSYKRNNHYLCIRKWVVDAVKEKKGKSQKGFNAGNGSNGIDELIKMMEG